MEDRANILRDMKVCRFCLTSEEPLMNIYEKVPKEKQSVPLPLQIMACIAIEVFANDGMPQLICKTCRSHTVQSYTFKTNCKKSDDALKLFLATGQLAKPFLKPFQMDVEENEAAFHSKSPQKPEVQSTSQQAPKPKRIKLEEEPTEIITLNFTEEGPESSQLIDNQDDSLELDESQDANDDEEESSSSRNTYSKRAQDVMQTNQVKTDCFPCPYCERSFPLKQLLDLHIGNHERDRSFECTECGRKFFTKYDLSKHFQTHSDERPFNCAACDKSFSRESLLHRHEKIHNDIPKFLCTECGRPFLTRENLEQHMEKHKKKRPFSCSICDKSFVFKQGLERHELVHSLEKPHKCNYCEASFTSTIKLTRHITSHAGLRPYPCKICGRTFLLSHHLTRHMRSHYAAQMSNQEEGLIGQHKCDICSMSFRRKDSLINHSAIHSMVNLRCAICNTSFENAVLVKEHITTHLSGLPFPCEKCDYSFETKDQLEEHEVKHAEMEYEEVIEKEVVLEAKLANIEDEQQTDEDEEYDDDDVAEFTITNDINNPEVVRRSKRTKNIKNYADFLKDELGSDLEDEESQQQPEQEDQGEQQEEEELPEGLKPIIRTQGTKVYTRKTTDGKLVPKAENTLSPLEEISQAEARSIEQLGLNPAALNAMPNKRFVNMKMGDKLVRVQKYIVTKDEMKMMAKQGILEMRGGTVLLKKPGQQILSIKPAESADIESFIGGHEMQNKVVQRPKTYERRGNSSEEQFVPENDEINL